MAVVRISDLTAATTPLAGTEIVEIEQGGNSRRATVSDIRGGGGGAARDAVTALTISSGVVNIDCALGDFFTLALTANVTSITFTNLPASGRGVSLAVRVRQDGTGGRTVALPTAFKATTGSDTAVQSAANAWTLLTITTFDQGTRWEYTMRGVAA
jgi:hypothetical protein